MNDWTRAKPLQVTLCAEVLAMGTRWLKGLR